MTEDNPVILLVMIAALAWLFRSWLTDYRRAGAGQPDPRAWPGAVPAQGGFLVLAAMVGLMLTGLETWSEAGLGLTEVQTRITLLFGVYTIAAAFAEELIFRGYLVVTRRGRAALVLSILGFSTVFALAHPFLWSWDRDGGFALHGGLKPWFSTAWIFLNSVVFYVLRFNPWNPRRSLAPSIVAHAAKNLSVFGVKGIQGFVDGWW